MKNKFISLLFFLVILLTACTGAPAPAPTKPAAKSSSTSNGITAEGKLIPATAVELAFSQGGLVDKVLVKSGDKVAAGDVLVRLVGIETVQAELAAAQLEQIMADQDIDLLKRSALGSTAQVEKALFDAQKAYNTEANRWNLPNSDNATDLELNIDDYVTTEEDYRAARDKFDKLLNKDESNRERKDALDDLNTEKKSLTEAYADLLEKVAANEQTLDEDQIKLLAVISALEVARENQSRLDEKNLDPEKLTAAKARSAAAAAHVAAAQAASEFYELRAPFSGTVLHLGLKPGETALPGRPVAFLADASTWTIKTKDLTETDITKIALGQTMNVKLDAFPGEEFTATVTDINPVGQEYLGEMTYEVTLTLAEPDPRFMWNMTVTVNIGDSK